MKKQRTYTSGLLLALLLSFSPLSCHAWTQAEVMRVLEGKTLLGGGNCSTTGLVRLCRMYRDEVTGEAVNVIALIPPEMAMEDMKKIAETTFALEVQAVVRVSAGKTNRALGLLNPKEEVARMSPAKERLVSAAQRVPSLVLSPD